MSQDEGNDLTRSDFCDGYTFCFDLTLDACDGSCFHLVKNATCASRFMLARHSRRPETSSCTLSSRRLLKSTRTGTSPTITDRCHIVMHRSSAPMVIWDCNKQKLENIATTSSTPQTPLLALIRKCQDLPFCNNLWSGCAEVLQELVLTVSNSTYPSSFAVLALMLALGHSVAP